MMRCLIDTGQWAADEIDLSPDESHHLIQVLRARPGERVGLFTGRGRTAEATFVAVRRKRALVRVLPATRRETPPPAVAVTLIQAIPKHALMDGIIQKAVELGAQAVQPLMTARVIVRLSAGNGRSTGDGRSTGAAEQRRGRWQKIALEAARQCGVAWVPSVLPVRSLPEIIPGLARFDLCLVGSLHADACPFREVVTKARGNLMHRNFPPLEDSSGKAAERDPPPADNPAGSACPQSLRSSVAGGGDPAYKNEYCRPGALTGRCKSRTVSGPSLRSIALVIGPEGDLTEQETTALREAGAQLVSFGKAVLRVETAALYGLSLLQYEFQA